jgi:bacterial/archaeal transporter family-2 protein
VGRAPVNWSSSTAAALIATAAIGALVALQPPVNSELGRRTSDLGAAFISVSITFLLLGAVLLAFGDVGSLSKVRDVPAVYLTGGLYGAAFVAVSLITVRQLGAGTTIAVLVSAQLVVAALLDQLGVLGLDQVSLTPLRLAGIATLILGTVLVTVR